MNQRHEQAFGGTGNNFASISQNYPSGCNAIRRIASAVAQGRGVELKHEVGKNTSNSTAFTDKPLGTQVSTTCRPPVCKHGVPNISSYPYLVIPGWRYDMDMYVLGATAAVLTSGLWTFNAILFTSAGKRIGAISVNAWRILFAVFLLLLAHFILLGRLLPEANGEQWFWIGLSGVVGLGIGDFGLFASFVIIGTRRAVLIFTLSAIFASVGAFFLFDEMLTMLAVIGIAITLAGVIIVLLEDETKSDEKRLSRRKRRLGISLALIGAIGQGLGLAFLKKGMLLYPETQIMSDTISLAVASTLIRMLLGAIFVWIVIIIWGKLPELKRALRDRRGMSFVTAGAFIGPFAGVTLSMLAAYLIDVGIAQTLLSLMPIFIIPVVWILYRQRTSWRGILGAFVAVAGVALLFLHK